MSHSRLSRSYMNIGNEILASNEPSVHINLTTGASKASHDINYHTDMSPNENELIRVPGDSSQYPSAAQAAINMTNDGKNVDDMAEADHPDPTTVQYDEDLPYLEASPNSSNSDEESQCSRNESKKSHDDYDEKLDENGLRSQIKQILSPELRRRLHELRLQNVQQNDAQQVTQTATEPAGVEEEPNVEYDEIEYAEETSLEDEVRPKSPSLESLERLKKPKEPEQSITYPYSSGAGTFTGVHITDMESIDDVSPTSDENKEEDTNICSESKGDSVPVESCLDCASIETDFHSCSDSIIEHDEEMANAEALQKEIMSILLAMPDMVQALSSSRGPCDICRDIGDDHPTLRCSLLWESDISPSALRGLVQFKSQLQNRSAYRHISEFGLESSSSVRSSLDSDDQNENQSQEEMIKKKLLMRAYHLPGNSWCQDYVMFIMNSHLIFGMCCSHKLHPVKFKQRLILLLGSVAFGLSLTNILYLFYLLGLERDIAVGANDVEIVKEINERVDLLWTVGALLHSFFDYALWNMVACGCSRHNCFRAAGWNVAVVIVSLLVVCTLIAVTIRAYGDFFGIEHESNEEGSKTAIEFGNDGEVDINFLWTYSVELVVSLFIYTPIIQTIFFSGVLGCGVLPFLGGRPYELRKMEKRDDGCAVDDVFFH